MGQYQYLVSVFKNELRQIFAYSVDFWVNFFGKMLTQVVIAYFLWGNIYRYNKTDMMAGYSFKGIVIYFTLAPLLMRVLQGANIGSMSREIYEGGLTKYLLYPINYYHYKLVSYLAHSFIYLLQMLIVYFAIFFFVDFPSEFHLSLYSLSMGIVAAFLGALLFFAIASILELVSFWADNIWSLLVMLRFIVSFLGGGFIPLSFFPKTWQDFANYTPFPYLINFPVQCFLGNIHFSQFFQGVLILILWFVFFQWLSVQVFKRGSLKYTGVGL